MGRMWAINNPEKFRAYQKNWKAQNRERINAKQKTEEYKAVKERWRATNIIEVRRANKDYRARTRLLVLAAYGGKCKCCDETNEGFLTLDHILNDGAVDRKKGLRGMNLYLELIKRGYPSDIQVLCWNCNCGRAMNNGVCPHVS